MISKQYFTLYNGVKIPCIGFGTWQISNDIVTEACLVAFKEGYIHIDSAKAYGNEEGVGKSIKLCGLKREDIFITTKVPAEIKTYEDAKRCIEESLKLLDTPYIDLILIHAPRPWDNMRYDYPYRYYEENVNVYRALEEAYEQGKVRSIGVSNFSIEDIENILKHNKIKPMVNQICVYAGDTPLDLIEYCKKQDILVEAYSPLGTGRVFKSDLLKQLADKYNVSIAELALRYTYQLGTLPLPKSVTPNRIKDNLYFDHFTISDEDMEMLKKYSIYG